MNATLSRVFQGYARDDRPLGVRNRVLVLPSVICSRVVADRIATRVPAARATPHDHGCAQIGADRDQTERTFHALSRNPNVAGAVVVGLGCESIQSDEVAEGIAARDVPVREVSIQDTGGTDECTELGVRAAKELAEEARSARRITGDLGDLTLGIVSSDAADSTVDIADPLIGRLARDIVDAGGRVAVAGIERLEPHAEAVVDATADDETAAALKALLERHQHEPGRATRVRRTAAEHSFEAIAATWGNQQIHDVRDYGERIRRSGVTVIEAPARFEEAVTGLAAAGAQLVVHATADGIPAGHPLVPVIKISGDRETVAALPDDIDIDAREAELADLVKRVVAVADGESSCAEVHGLSSFAITRIGPSM